MRIRILAIFAMLVLTACSDTPPKSLADMPGVVKVNDPNFSASAGTLVMDIKAEGFTGFTLDATQIVHKIKRYFPAELDRHTKIWVFGTTTLVDKYGNQSAERTVGIEWPTEELKKAQTENSNFSTWHMLNLASDVRGFQGVGHDMFIEYCKDETNQKYGLPFCALYVKKYLH